MGLFEESRPTFDDECDLVTDYELSPGRFLYQKEARRVAPIVFTLWGGRAVFEGVEVTYEDHDVLPLIDGLEYVVLFVEDQTRPGGYRPVNPAAGIFDVRNDRVDLRGSRTPYGDGFEAVRGIELGQLETTIRRLKQ
jgi:hypothetical protein